MPVQQLSNSNIPVGGATTVASQPQRQNRNIAPSSGVGRQPRPLHGNHSATLQTQIPIQHMSGQTPPNPAGTHNNSTQGQNHIVLGKFVFNPLEVDDFLVILKRMLKNHQNMYP